MDNLFFDLGKLKYLGHGARIGKTVRIRKPELVSIGDGCIIDDFTYISCEMTLGKYCHIAAGVNISGGAGSFTAGDYVAISAGCSLHAASSEFKSASLDLPSVPEEMRFGGVVDPIVFGDHIVLGSHTVVLPGVRLPIGVATGAMTVLRYKKYEPWTLYVGSDAKPSMTRDHRQLDTKLGLET